MHMRRRALLRLLLGAAGLGISGCGRDTFVYRYRLTLEIETPEGVKIGSGVLECRAFDDTNAKIYFAERRAGSRVRGEAVAVDLGHRGVLFVLLARAASITSSEAADVPEAAARRAGLVVDGRTQTPKRYDLFTDLLREVSALRGKIPAWPAELPMLVRFRDTGDPRSVEVVDPNDLEKSFGPGVKLSRATVEITSDPVTTGIEKRLGWLPKQRGSLVYDAVGPTDYSHPERVVNQYAFKRGD